MQCVRPVPSPFTQIERTKCTQIWQQMFQKCQMTVSGLERRSRKSHIEKETLPVDRILK